MKYMSNVVRAMFLGLFVLLLIKQKIALWLALYVASLIAALVFGRIYCGYICPMNTLLIPVDWLSKKLNHKRADAPKWLKNGYFTWITLGVSLAIMFLSKRLLHADLPILPFWLAMSILITIWYKPAVFHNLICPFGALQNTFGTFARLSKKVDKEACIGCKICENVCPCAAIAVSSDDKKAMINTKLCYQCENCKQVCPKNAVHYCARRQ